MEGKYVKLIMKNKKAQFYIFTMILLLVITTTFVLTKPVKTDETQGLTSLLDNIDNELPYVVNNAVKNSLNITNELNIFFNNFADYARTKRTELYFFYIYANESSFVMKNGFPEKVFLVTYNETLPAGRTITKQRQDADQLAVQLMRPEPDLTTFIYKFYITNEDTQLRYLVFAKQGDICNIRIKDS